MRPESLAPMWREYYEERAAIREFCGHQGRREAEREAMKETMVAMEANFQRRQKG